MKRLLISRQRGLAIVAFAALLPAAAFAQAPILDVAETLQGGQERDEKALPRGEHRVRLAPGQRVIASARSLDFDTVLQVLRADQAQPIAENDDFGGGLNSRLVFTADREGDYIFRVASYSPEQAGSYQLRVDAAPSLPAARDIAGAARTASWRILEGHLQAGDAEGSAGRFDDLRVDIAAGRQVIILVDAVNGEFDPVVAVYRESERDGAPLAHNDDGAVGLGSVLLFTAPETGSYVLRVSSYGGGATGRYLLRVGEAPNAGRRGP